MPVQYIGEEFTFHNPDGTEIKVRGFGNQFAVVFETMDGFTVAKDPQTGFFHYATLSPDGTALEPTGPRVGDARPEQLGMPRHLRVTAEAARAQARAAQDATGVRPRWEIRRDERRRRRARSAPGSDGEPTEEGLQAATIGNYVGLCILVQFPDVLGTIPSQDVTNFCNQVGYSGFGNNGSVRDYFRDVSDGRLTYTNAVTAYYTAQYNRAHYTDPGVAYGTRARELIIEALDHLKVQGFDFAQLTADGSGFVRALNVFYAGPTVNSWSEGLWPHSSALASPYTATSTRKFSDYQITNIGSQLTLRTFCHENGHMICDFPDLYDYGYESNGVGHYCLMCAGGSNTNPTQICAYLKNFAGWTSSLRQIAPGQALTVAAGRNDFLIHRKNTTEYFIIENRRRTGRDAALPDEGIAIWHVDENGSNNNEQMTAAQHYECSLEQADGRFDLERRVNYGDANDLYGAPAALTFGASTTPNSHWWDGTASGLQITDITAPGVAMTVSTQAHESVALQANNGQYVCAEGSGGREVVANRSAIGQWETFTLIDRGRSVALRASNGQYVCAEGGGGREVVANRSAMGPWETFTLIGRGGGQVALQANNGQYVCAEDGGGREVVANRGRIGEWEMFTLIDRGSGQVALQANNGQYVCAEGSGGREVVANRSAIGQWETFTLIDRGRSVALQANNGQYVCAEGSGGREVVANRGAVGPWETFALIDRGGGQVALQANNGQYVCAEGGGGREVVANRNAIGPWETFTLIEPSQLTVPMYRYWNSGAADHFYTTNWNELGSGNHGWGYEGIQCYVYPGQEAGSVPLYRYWNSGAADHFYTTNWNELGSGNHGWGYEGIQCYVFAQPLVARGFRSPGAVSLGATGSVATGVPASFRTKLAGSEMTGSTATFTYKGARAELGGPVPTTFATRTETGISTAVPPTFSRKTSGEAPGG